MKPLGRQVVRVGGWAYRLLNGECPTASSEAHEPCRTGVLSDELPGIQWKLPSSGATSNLCLQSRPGPFMVAASITKGRD